LTDTSAITRESALILLSEYLTANFNGKEENEEAFKQAQDAYLRVYLPLLI
jgi:hypothetical protein